MFVSVFVLPAIMFFADDDASKADLDKLQGTWQLVSVEADGMKAPAEEIKKSSLVIKGNVATPHDDGKADEKEAATVTLDASKTPRTITFKEKDKDETKYGIYVLEGDTLKICVKLAGNEHPKDFAAGAASGCLLMVLKKAEK